MYVLQRQFCTRENLEEDYLRTIQIKILSGQLIFLSNLSHKLSLNPRTCNFVTIVPSLRLTYAHILFNFLF